MATDANHKELLLEGRRALAVGDLKRAGSLAQQAKAHRAAYDPLDDTPEQLEAAIRKYQEVMSQPKHSEAYRRGLAKMLMEQSEALLRAGDLDVAEQLADRASRQGITLRVDTEGPLGPDRRLPPGPHSGQFVTAFHFGRRAPRFGVQFFGRPAESY